MTNKAVIRCDVGSSKRRRIRNRVLNKQKEYEDKMPKEIEDVTKDLLGMIDVLTLANPELKDAHKELFFAIIPELCGRIIRPDEPRAGTYSGYKDKDICGIALDHFGKVNYTTKTDHDRIKLSVYLKRVVDELNPQ